MKMMNSTFQIYRMTAILSIFPFYFNPLPLEGSLLTHPNGIWHKAVFKVGVSHLHGTRDKLLALLYWDISSTLALQLLIKYEMCCQTSVISLCSFQNLTEILDGPRKSFLLKNAFWMWNNFLVFPIYFWRIYLCICSFFSYVWISFSQTW